MSDRLDRATTAHRPWLLYGAVTFGSIAAAALVLGIVVLPLSQSGGDPLNPFEAICRALGIGTPQSPPEERARRARAPSSGVAWTPEVTSALAGADRDRGAFVAVNCAVCHGSGGWDGANAFAPNLAGLQAEVIWKQLHDYRAGRRQWPVMNAIARALEEPDIANVALHFGPAGQPSRQDFRAGRGAAPPALVVRGDTHRGIAPCQSCHGAENTDRRVMMAPRLEGQRADYIARQLGLFRTAWRRNDVYRPMREVAAALTDEEVRHLAEWYAARPAAAAARSVLPASTTLPGAASLQASR